MTEKEFIENIQDEITGSGSLPIVLEEKEIKRIINQSRHFFTENWHEAVNTNYYIIKKSEFQSEIFKKTRTIKMPQCVVSVIEVKEINGAGRMGNIDRDFSENKLVASEIFLNNTQGDDLVYRIAQMQYYDLTKALFLTNISYDHNRNTNELIILGRDPRYDVFIKTLSSIPDDKLFNDYYFLRYCTAKAKISLARIMGMYPFQLPGGVQPDVSMIRQEGEDEIAWILERLDSEQPPDWIIMWS